MCSSISVLFALEIVLALRRLVDSEMVRSGCNLLPTDVYLIDISLHNSVINQVYGNGDLHPSEWESFCQCMDSGISPWFSLKPSIDNNELFEEINALFTQIQCFLAKVPEVDHGFHPIVDEEAR